jgi:hypothetical protein
MMFPCPKCVSAVNQTVIGIPRLSPMPGVGRKAAKVAKIATF